MNNYPDGFIPKVEQKAVDLVCSVCGYMWEAVILTEFCFSWFADDEYGNICPECGEEGADGVKITDQEYEEGNA